MPRSAWSTTRASDERSSRRTLSAPSAVRKWLTPSRLIRALPEPDATQRSLEAPARLRASRAETPEISEADIETALSASRAELERRTVPDLHD